MIRVFLTTKPSRIRQQTRHLLHHYCNVQQLLWRQHYHHKLCVANLTFRELFGSDTMTLAIIVQDPLFIAGYYLTLN